ncbi:hypothetical protein BH23CHL1_BH23CHL1_21880 [soil metagenome]
MSTISNTNENAVSWPNIGKSGSKTQNRQPRGGRKLWTYLSVASMAIPAAMLLVAGVIAGLPAEDGAIESGVRIGGYQVGNAGWQQTSADLEASLQSYLNEPVVLQLGERTQEVAPAALGISFDMDATFARAMAVGRGGVVEAASERFVAHTSGVNVSPVVTYDSGQFMDILGTLSQGVIQQPVDARFGFENGQIVIEPSQDGVGIDSQSAALNLQEAAGEFDHGPVEIPTVSIDPNVSTADLEAVQADANRLAGQPLRLFYEGDGWQLGQQELVSLLGYANGAVSLNMTAVEQRIGALASAIDTPARNATIQHSGDGTFAIVPETLERNLDSSASVEVVESALRQDEHDVVLVVTEQSPPIVSERLQPLHQEITDIMSRGMLLTWPEGQQWLNPVEYANVFQFNEQDATLSIDREKLSAAIKPIADEVGWPASGLRWKGGQFVTTPDSDPGRSVDLPITVTKVAEGALNGNPVVELAIGPAEDPAQMAGDITITDMLANASTYYGDSGTNRRINVEVGAAALDGVLIPPGGTFSFNDAVGGSTGLDDGYQMGYGIITGSDGVPKTVPSVAGGICQVATTAFQAAFWSGMEITNRNWHLYWIPNYGNGTGGLQGLDATVDADYDLDSNWVNPTDNWVAVRSYTDGSRHHVEIWGTNQNWTVEVDEPVITNVVAADKNTVHREESPDIEPGQEVHVETARDGFNASIHRVVKDASGQVINDRTFDSYYQPSRNVVLVAPGEGGR